MLVSLNWLRNYVDLGTISAEQLAEKITKTGIEVDGIEYISKQSSGVVVGYVKLCEQHPNADKLKLCQVDIGNEELQIICGAPNVKQGQKVAVARPGAVLPGNFKIKKVKLRGIESNGMICSLKELGINEKYVPLDAEKGIFVFPEATQIGKSVESLLNLNDAILEFDLTPNRADCLSMLGIAYEVAAILDIPVKIPEESYKATEENSSDYISIQVDDSKQNPYYGAFMIKDIEIKPSPLWMRNYLIASGIRPINNVVDITNFVLLEYGQPLHAFDYDRLQSKEIVVRRARANETMVTLDGKDRMLLPDHLVITNGSDPIALAGVMGGANTEVNGDTTAILLEAAYFNSGSVRKTVLDTGLRSEASTRYEKGVDPNRVKRAGIRACELLEKYAGGSVLAGVVEFDELDRSEKIVKMNTKEINKRLGTEISTEEIKSILTKLHFSFELEKEQFSVTIPTRRGDITIFEDMLEEVARIYGYDNLPYTLPTASSRPGALTERQQLTRKVKNYLQGVGLMETITYSLTREDYVEKLISPDLKDRHLEPIKVAMPISEDHNYLRLSILSELLHAAAYNRARTQTNLAYYELGSVFTTDQKILTKQPEENMRLAGVLTGMWREHRWQREIKGMDFYVAKGIVEGLFHLLEIPIAFTQAKLDNMHPGRCASVSAFDKVLGFVGQVHPTLAKDMDLDETYVFDINLEKAFELFDATPTYRKIPRYPSTTRDVAFIVDKGILAGSIKDTIEKAGAPLIKKVEVFDVYTGENIPDEKKSIAYSIHYQHPEKTLTDEEVDDSYQRVVKVVNETFHAYVRS